MRRIKVTKDRQSMGQESGSRIRLKMMNRVGTVLTQEIDAVGDCYG
jgi:hypothetical protein